MDELNEQQQQRIKKLDALREAGVAPYGTRFEAKDRAGQLITLHAEKTKEVLEEEKISCTFAGRIIALRRFAGHPQLVATRAEHCRRRGHCVRRKFPRQLSCRMPVRGRGGVSMGIGHGGRKHFGRRRRHLSLGFYSRLGPGVA